MIWLSIPNWSRFSQFHHPTSMPTGRGKLTKHFVSSFFRLSVEKPFQVIFIDIKTKQVHSKWYYGILMYEFSCMYRMDSEIISWIGNFASSTPQWSQLLMPRDVFIAAQCWPLYDIIGTDQPLKTQIQLVVRLKFSSWKSTRHPK